MVGQWGLFFSVHVVSVAEDLITDWFAPDMYGYPVYQSDFPEGFSQETQLCCI